LSFLFGIVLFLGMEAIFLSMNFLFGVELPAAVHGCAVFLVSGLIAPMLGLALVPASFTQERKGYPAYLKVVVAWAVAPLLAGYALVLYAYMLKILVLWTLPAGGVAWMVKGFACTGLLTYFILYPLARQGDRVAGLFCRYFFKALIPPLLLLAVALATRVFEYGVTEKRYMLLLSFTALVVATALSFRPRQERYLQTVFGVLTALVVLAAVGPLSAVNLSVFSQTHRLESLLVKYGRLADGQIVTSGPDIPWADVVSINSAVEFLVKRDRDDKLAPWFVAAKDNPFADGVADNGDEHIPGIFGRMFSFRDAEPIVKAMGIRYVPRWEYGQEATAAVEHFRFNFATANYYNGVTQVSGYDYMLQGSFSSWQEDPVIFALERPPVEVTGTLEGNSLTFVKASSGRRLTFDLAPLVQQLQQQGVAEAEATPPPAVLEARNADFRARLEVGELSGEYPDGDHAKPEVQSVQYRLFLRNQ
jgi:hypothetical protein